MKTSRWKRFCRFWNQPKHAGYLFILPSCISLAVFLVFPLFFSVAISLTELDQLKLASYNPIDNWVGIENFVKAFTDDAMWQSIRNTLWFFILETPTQIIVGLLAAACMTKTDLFTRFMRSVFFIPVLASGTALGIIWSMILSQNVGLIPYYIQQWFNLAERPAPLNDATWAMVVIAMMTVWKGFGQTMIILVAGLQGISKSYYEAAEIDGANKVQQFFKITVPLVIPTLSFCIVTNTTGSLQVFDQIQSATRGGPNFATRSAVMYIYYQAYSRHDLGYASTVAVVLFIIIILISGVFRIFLNRRERKML